RTSNIALIEIVFNARTPEHIPYYLMEEDDDDLMKSLLQDILIQGQKLKEFRDFDSQLTATIIQGAISESMLNYQSNISIEAYSEELVIIIFVMVNMNSLSLYLTIRAGALLWVMTKPYLGLQSS